MRHRIRDLRPILGLALLVAAAPMLAQPPIDGPPDEALRHGRGIAWMAEKLELSDGQREELRAAFMEESRFDAWRALAEARQILEEQVRAELFDETAIREAAAALAAVEADMAVARARHAQKLRQVLTPEQLEELERMRDERHRLRGFPGHRGPHRQGRFGPPGRAVE